MKDFNKEDLDKYMTPEQVPDEMAEEGRELPDEQLEGIAGGTMPIVSPFA